MLIHYIGRASAIMFLLTSLAHFANAEDPSLIADGEKLALVADEFNFTEGPAADREGNIFFTDQPNNRIMEWSVEGKLSTFLQPAGRSNGLFFDQNEMLIACADEKNELWSIDKAGTPTVIANKFETKALNGPNDCWIHPSGAIYFTDPYYQRPWWDHKTAPQANRGVYRLSPDRKTLTPMDVDFKQPNGIIGDAGKKVLYVADIGDKKTYRYEIAENGNLIDRTLFCEQGSDGMTIDTEGNVYLTGNGVMIYSPEGKLLQTIEVPQRWTANVCFGGQDRKTLFITANKAAYTIKMKTQGLPPL